jgi:mercuric ion transport protein
MLDMIRSIRGYVSIAVGIITCPCHLPLTLPILLSLTAGTALGVWLKENTQLVFVLSTILFIGGLTLGNMWLKEDKKPKRQPRVAPTDPSEAEQLRLGRSCERCEPHVQTTIHESDGSLYEEVQG